MRKRSAHLGQLPLLAGLGTRVARQPSRPDRQHVEVHGGIAARGPPTLASVTLRKCGVPIRSLRLFFGDGFEVLREASVVRRRARACNQLADLTVGRLGRAFADFKTRAVSGCSRWTPSR